MACESAQVFMPCSKSTAEEPAEPVLGCLRVKSFSAKPRSSVLATFVKLFHYHESDLPFTLACLIHEGRVFLVGSVCFRVK